MFSYCSSFLVTGSCKIYRYPEKNYNDLSIIVFNPFSKQNFCFQRGFESCCCFCSPTGLVSNKPTPIDQIYLNRSDAEPILLKAVLLSKGIFKSNRKFSRYKI